MTILEAIPLPCELKSMAMFTKTLAFQPFKGSNGRKLVVSTRYLEALGWCKDLRINEEVIGVGKGLRITRSPIGVKGDKKVYDRGYKNRDYRETLLDIRSQKRINEAFLGATSAHIQIKSDEIIITPIASARSLPTKTGSIEIPANFMPDTILNVLDTIDHHKLTHIDIDADQDFWQSNDSLLMQTQLRRKGYHITIKDSSMVRISTDNQDIACDKHYELTQPINITAPPKPVIGSKVPTFVGMSGGVDAFCLEKEGFEVKYGMEYRPQEARDGERDKTELYALSLTKNSHITHMFNEDIYRANLSLIAHESRFVAHSHFSLSCTDYTPLKCAKDKEKAFANLSTTRDMFIPLLKLIELQAPLTLSIENVIPFANSRECEIVKYRLGQLGYQVSIHKMSAPDYGGLTNRNRCYMYASLYGTEGFYVENPDLSSTVNAWDAISFDFENMSDITDTKSVQKGIESGRLRPFKQGAHIAPTVTRSQDRGTKDAVNIELNGRYYKPTISQIMALVGIDKTFDISFLSKEVKTEILGQSVDVPMHSHWANAILRSITDFNIQ